MTRRADDDLMASSHLTADIGVIERAKRGDRDALGELWRTYNPQVLRLLRAKRIEAADDVASQVWIDAGRALGRFEGDGRGFQKWLFTIAGRRAIDETRRTKRRRERPLDIDSDFVEPVPGPDGSLDSSIALVASLPPQMAEAVMLRVVHDLAPEEVAEIMDTSVGNVRVLTHRGLGKLRARLAQPVSSVESPDDRVIAVDFVAPGIRADTNA